MSQTDKLPCFENSKLNIEFCLGNETEMCQKCTYYINFNKWFEKEEDDNG